jgi:hypothetical protein
MSKEITLLPNPQEWSQLKDLCAIALKSGLLPSSIKTVEQAIVIALKGREIGIPPMLAFSQISVINGKPAMQSELMLSQIYKFNPTACISFIKSDEKECVIEASRKGSKPSLWSFTLEDAKAAQLLGKDNWKKYPSAMLRARAISAMARAVYPDSINGVSYTPDELGAEIDIAEDGTEIVRDVTPKNEKPKDSGSEEVGADLPKNDNKSSENRTNVTPPQNPTPPPVPKPIVNHAPLSAGDVRLTVDTYKTRFSIFKWPQGTTFADLGVHGTKELQTSLKAHVLKCTSSGVPINQQITEFLDFADEYLKRFE